MIFLYWRMAKNQDRLYYSFRKNILRLEKNSVSLPAEGLVSLALVFPNAYAVGMANLGFQTVYRLFNEFPGIRCERLFYDSQFPAITRTLESNRELRDFDVIAFSLSFELDLPHVLQVLVNAGITSFSSERHHREPLVIAGGALTFLNPAPLAPFVDAFVIGEIETIVEPLLNLLLESKKQLLSKNNKLQLLHDLPGIYVPNLFNGTDKIAKIQSDLKNQCPQYSPIVSPFSHFKNMFLIEVGRGCSRHCHFCAASFIYHPFRLFNSGQILENITTHNKATKRIGLIGAAISDDPDLEELCQQLVDEGYELGLSSFRLDKMTPAFLKILDRAKVKSITLAPEAGTERLRKVIHKNLTFDQIIRAAEAIAWSSINQIKLYFLIGLPSETWEDIQGIVSLISTLQNIFLKNKKQKKIIVSVNTFIPKPFTPFQWAAMEEIAAIKRKRKFLQTELIKIPAVRMIEKSSKEELLQGIFSLGDHRVGLAIYEQLTNKSDWQEALKKCKVAVEEKILAAKEFEQTLPWDFIETGIKKRKLWQMWQQVIKTS